MLGKLFNRLRQRRAPEPSYVPQDEPEEALSMPAGGPWAPFWDTAFNVRLEMNGRGWRNYEAVELWRAGWSKPSFTFTCVLMGRPEMNAYGLWWRPLRSAAHIDRRWN